MPLKVLAWEDAAGSTWVARNEAEYLLKKHRFSPELVKNIVALGTLVAAVAGDEH
jgi:hypothetical protein